MTTNVFELKRMSISSSGMESRKPIPEHIQRRILKVFVTNLPEGCSGNDLALHVRPFGNIFDLYIARKRDKGGNRFGFISLLDVKDKDDLLRDLRTIRMGDYKLWFNVARFVLEEGEINNHRVEKPYKAEPRKEVHCNVEVNSTEVGAKSFKDMLVGRSITVVNDGVRFGSVHGLAVVARLVDFSVLKSIKILLKELSFKEERIQYIGGLDLLITFSDHESAVKFKKVASTCKDKFAFAEIWEGQVLGFERIAWLKIQGIPLHVLSNEVVDLVGGLFGKVVHKATRTDIDVDLSYEYVGVLAGDGKRITEEITLNWKDRKFRVWVTEDNKDWFPEFIEPSDMGISENMENDVEDDHDL
ncbi:putative RNA recognition motif domain, nucleotide-binding alpha-beta plait domain superfamily [Helianthus annuus]|nr:putative RNA recognition motif domain, nucleotide-binding alpha-beta plait domain superfamily [Helianthus annuus]